MCSLVDSLMYRNYEYGLRGPGTEFKAGVSTHDGRRN